MDGWLYLGVEGEAEAVTQCGLCVLACWGCKQAVVPGVLCSSNSTDWWDCLSHRLLLSVNSKQTGSTAICPTVNSPWNTNNNSTWCLLQRDPHLSVTTFSPDTTQCNPLSFAVKKQNKNKTHTKKHSTYCWGIALFVVINLLYLYKT